MFHRVVVHDHFFAIMDLAFDNQPAQAGFDLLLNGALEWTGSVGWIVTRLNQVGAGRIG